MKKYLLSMFFVLGVTLLNAQSTHTIDFEAAGVGADWNWVVADNADNPALEFIANPVSGGLNTSAQVAKFTARATGYNWALFHSTGDGEFTFDATNSIVKIMVYKTTISNVGFKVEGLGGAKEIKIANTLVNQWEEITYDFSSEIGKSFEKLVIIPDFVEPYVTGQDRAAEHIIYIDNIQVPDGEVVVYNGPTVSAEAPAEAEADVLSVYSDAYTDITGVNFNPGWGQSTAVSFETIGSDNVMKYSGLNYQGTEFSNMDVSAYDYIHVDYWTANSTTLRFFLISPGKETPYTFNVVTDQWNSVDIPLSTFSSVVDLTDVFQFKIDGNGTVYFDNLYFFKGQPVPTSVNGAEKTLAKVFVANGQLVTKGLTGSDVEIYSASGQLVKKSKLNGSTLSLSDVQKGVLLVKIDGKVYKVVSQ